jgi:hypothetical protein
MPAPDTDRSIDILDTYFAAILKTNVDPIADALMDDGGDADPAGLCEWLQACGNIDAIAIDVVALNNDIAEIDANAQVVIGRSRDQARTQPA